MAHPYPNSGGLYFLPNFLYYSTTKVTLRVEYVLMLLFWRMKVFWHQIPTWLFSLERQRWFAFQTVFFAAAVFRSVTTEAIFLRRCGLVVMTFALYAKGPEFDPQYLYSFSLQ